MLYLKWEFSMLTAYLYWNGFRAMWGRSLQNKRDVTNVTLSLIGWNRPCVSRGKRYKTMMTSSSGNIFRVTDPLWGESTGRRWIPLTKATDSELWWFLWSASEQPVVQTIETSVIWDTITLSMTSLYCGPELVWSTDSAASQSLVIVGYAKCWSIISDTRRRNLLKTCLLYKTKCGLEVWSMWQWFLYWHLKIQKVPSLLLTPSPFSLIYILWQGQLVEQITAYLRTIVQIMIQASDLAQILYRGHLAGNKRGPRKISIWRPFSKMAAMVYREILLFALKMAADSWNRIIWSWMTWISAWRM